MHIASDSFIVKRPDMAELIAEDSRFKISSYEEVWRDDEHRNSSSKVSLLCIGYAYKGNVWG